MPESSNTFTSVIEKFNSNLWGFHFIVAERLAKPFINGKDKRVLCTLNKTETFQCALMPLGDGNFFINVNKKLRDKLNLEVGSEVTFNLQKDKSEYGLPMPEELAELMKLDDEGHRLFHALTPGKQRTLLYIIGTPKNTDIRIRRAIAVINHLKENKGKINYRLLNEGIKNTP